MGQHILVCLLFIAALIAYTNLIQKSENETA